MSKRFKEVERPQISERLDYVDIVRRQMDRCLQSLGDEVLYAQNVIGLEDLIHDTDITKEYSEAVEKCQTTYEYSTPVMSCGVPVNPDILPETVEKVEETDFHCRFNAAVNLFGTMGITWKRTEGLGL